MATKMEDLRAQAIEYLTYISGGEVPTEKEIQDYLEEYEESFNND